jgi:Domain of unknown function (DUF4263)
VTISANRLRMARDEFISLLRHETKEHAWQDLFCRFPFILSESLPLRVDVSQIAARGRPGRSEADFVIYPENLMLPSPYGVIEIKRPSTQLLTLPRKDVLRLSADADTAYAQARKYARDLDRELHTLPGSTVAIGGTLHIFLIMGLSDELTAKVTNSLLREQFSGLLPAGVQLLPYDTILRLLERRIPPQIHFTTILPGIALPSAANDAIQTPPTVTLRPLLLSPSKRDKEFMIRFVGELQHQNAAHVVYDERPICVGDALRQQLRELSHSSKAVLVILDAAAVHSRGIMNVVERTGLYARTVGIMPPVAITLADKWVRREPMRLRSLVQSGCLAFNLSDWEDASVFTTQMTRIMATIA